jgi:nucleolar protein 14
MSQRRETLLPEMQRRNKAGGIVDRRIGEDDPTMTPEQRALERYAQEQKRKKGASLFDLEDDDDDDDFLTHGGQRIDLEADDFNDEDLSQASDDIGSDNERKRKRMALDILAAGEDDEDAGEGPARKKSKAEVMKEVIAKSKLYKYERQQAKEDDEVVRDELDKGLGDLRATLAAYQRSLPPKQPSNGHATPTKRPMTNGNDQQMDPGRRAMMESAANPDQSYDQLLRKMVQDKRAKPTDRTKTEEELRQEEADRVKRLEEERIRRMNGEPEESEEEFEQDLDSSEDNAVADDAAAFGLEYADETHTRPEGIDDEDDFVIDEDYSGSELSDEESTPSEEEFEDDLLEPMSGSAKYLVPTGVKSSGSVLACPRSLDEVKNSFQDIPADEIGERIRRIRITHDPALDAGNKEKLAEFSAALVAYLGDVHNSNPLLPLSTIDSIIRHVHSMAKRNPDPVNGAFRTHLRLIRPSARMSGGDLIVLSAIGSIYPTSDHFHSVVVPAMILMARWLGKTKPVSVADIKTGGYLGALCLDYAAKSRRYIPELVLFTIRALQTEHTEDILQTHFENLRRMSDLWFDKPAFIDIVSPALLHAIKSHATRQMGTAETVCQRLALLLKQAQLNRRHLELHHHRPIAIKMSVPKFEDNFDPSKHYDPNRERAEGNKLQKELKKERKGALRELRKDAQFMSRERLREKKERDAAYEKKYKRLVAEIQGEEGKESNAYEREKRLRQRKK